MFESKNLILRPIQIEDIEYTQKWRNDPEIIISAQLNRYPKTFEVEKSWFERVLNDTSNRNIYFAMVEKSSSKMIGIIQLTDIDWISRTCAWGFIIGEKSKRGLGYHIEAPKLLFNYAFNFLGLRKISSYAIESNDSTLVMHKLLGNFVEEGRLKDHVYYNGKYYDVLILSLFKN